VPFFHTTAFITVCDKFIMNNLSQTKCGVKHWNTCSRHTLSDFNLI